MLVIRDTGVQGPPVGDARSGRWVGSGRLDRLWLPAMPQNEASSPALRRTGAGGRLFDVANHLFLILLSLSILLPFMRQITISLSTADEALRFGAHLVPDFRKVTLASYERIFQTDSIARAYYWTLARIGIGTTLTLLVTGMLAYPLAKRYLPLRRFWTLFVVLTLFFAGGLIPLYLLVRGLGLINTVWALVLPGLVSTFALIVMRSYLMTLPEDLEESARVDGANDLLVFFRIVMPMSKPVFAVVALWTIVYHWNEWFHALIFVTDPRIKVIQQLLRRVLLESDFSYAGLGTTETAAQMMAQERQLREYTPETIKAAILMVTTVPILLAYPFMQKYFVKGTLIGALKG